MFVETRCSRGRPEAGLTSSSKYRGAARRREQRRDSFVFFVCFVLKREPLHLAGKLVVADRDVELSIRD
jgi:hypothetical protein